MKAAIRGWQHVVAAGLGLLMVSGVYIDGWAHLNRPGLETFFTPWHAILYGGFALLATFIVGSGTLRRNERRRRRWAPLPGYGPAVLGLGLFLVGGVLDMFWHEIFGIEAGVDTLLSPTHLVLLVGGMLMVTTPARVAARDDSAMGLAALATSVATTSALVAFFLSYVSVFADPGAVFPMTALPEGAPGHREAELPVVAGLAGYLVTTAAILVPILSVRRLRPDLVPGITSTTVATAGLLGSVLTEFRFLVPALGAVMGAVLTDVSLRWWPSGRDRWLALGFGLPAAMWAGQLLGLTIAQRLAWSVELWAGVVVLTALTGGALALLTGSRSGLDQRSTTLHSSAPGESLEREVSPR